MNPFEPQFNDAVPEGGQQQIGFSPTKTYDIGQKVLQEYERSEKNRRFFDQSRQERLKTSIENKKQEEDDIQTYYKGLEGLKDFSGTVEKFVQAGVDAEKEKRRKKAQFEVANRVWEQGATDEERAGYQEGQAAAAESRGVRAEAADESIRDTGNTDIATWINSSDPYTAQYRAEALAVQSGDEYQGWLKNALANNTDTLPGFDIRVNEARGEVERRAAVTYLRNLYLTTSGMGIINPALIDDKIYPKMKTGEAAAFAQVLKQDRIAQGDEDRQRLSASIGPTTDINSVVAQIAQTSNASGTGAYGYTAAWKLVTENAADALLNGRMTVTDLQAMGKQIDPVTGKPISEARPDLIPEIIDLYEKGKSFRLRNQQGIRTSEAQAAEREAIQGLDPNKTYSSAEANKILQDLRRDPRYSGYRFGALEQILRGASPAQEGREAAARYAELAANGTPFTTQEYDAAVPFEYRDNRVRDRGIDATEAEQSEAAEKRYMPTAIKNVMGIMTKGDASQRLLFEYRYRDRWRTLYDEAQLNDPTGNPDKWAKAAGVALLKEVVDAPGNSKALLHVDANGNMPNYTQEAASVMSDSERRPLAESFAQEQKDKGITLTSVKTDEKGEVTETGLGFTRANLENLDERLQSGTFPNAWRFATIAKVYGVSVATAINSQLKALGLPEIDTEVLQRFNAATPVQVSYMASPEAQGGYLPSVTLAGNILPSDGQYNNSLPMIRGEDPNPLVVESALKYGIPPAILASLLMQESGLQDKYVFGRELSSSGAIGIAQFLPGTAAQMGIDPYDWKQSIDGAGKYLRHLMDRYGFDLETAIYAYNAGPGTVLDYGVGATEENANYFPEIRERARQMMIRRYRYGDQSVLRSPYLIRPGIPLEI